VDLPKRTVNIFDTNDDNSTPRASELFELEKEKLARIMRCLTKDPGSVLFWTLNILVNIQEEMIQRA
jgi:hypothetical protein